MAASVRSPRVPPSSARGASSRNLSSHLVSPAKGAASNSAAVPIITVAGSLSEGLAPHRTVHGSVTLLENEVLVVSLGSEEATLRDKVVELYECSTLGFVTFEPSNAEDGARLVDHLNRVRRDVASAVERAAALHGAAFGRHVTEMVAGQWARCAEKLRQAAELMPAEARSQARPHEAKDAECMRLADDIVRYLGAQKEKDNKKEKHRERGASSPTPLKDKHRSRAVSSSALVRDKKDKEERDKGRARSRTVAESPRPEKEAERDRDKERRRAKTVASAAPADEEALAFVAKLPDYREHNKEAAARFVRTVVPKQDYAYLESFLDAVSSSDTERAARGLLQLNAAANNAQALAVHLARREAARAAMPFRSNSPTVRFLILHLRRVAAPFLSVALRGPMAQYFEAPKPLEVDPQRLSSSSSLSPSADSRAAASRNVQNLRNMARLFLESIYKAVDTLPPEVAEICAAIKQEAEKRGLKATTVLSTFMFLRFICPTLVSPDQYGVFPAERIPSGCRRGLILVSKLVQLAANEAEGGHKEEYMAPFTEFLAQQAAPVHLFVATLPTVTGSRQVSGSRLLLAQAVPTIEEQNAALTSLHTLCVSTLPHMEGLDATQRAFFERLLTELGSQRRATVEAGAPRR